MEQKFFLNSNSSKGFYSYYNELEKDDFSKLYLVVGAPGTGKSTLMIKKEKEINDNDIEKIYCSSDYNSLDAIIFNNNKLVYADSTSPHILNVKYPIVKDNIINLYQYINDENLENEKENIINAINKKQLLYQRVYKFLHIAGKLDEEIKNTNSQNLDIDKIKKSAKNYIYKNIGMKPSKVFKTKKRFLSSISYNGIITFFNEVSKNYEKIFVYEDNIEINNIFMQEISEYLNQLKISHIKCYCALQPDKIEHILIPDKNTAFITSNKYHTYTGKYYRKINAKRFINNSYEQSNRTKFNKKAKILFLKKSIEILYEAKNVHETLEKIFNKAMDFSKI